jgi:hypothetical protein
MYLAKLEVWFNRVALLLKITEQKKKRVRRVLSLGCWRWKCNGYTGSPTGPDGGSLVGTKEVERERWRHAMAPAGQVGRHE